MNKDILVFGGSGWLGRRITEDLDCASTDKKVNTYEDIQSVIDEVKPKVIINCIAHFGKNVDECEKDKNKTLQTLTFIPITLAEAAIRNSLKLVHLSSGCLFNYDYSANRPIEESEPPDFFDLFYSRAKIYTEYALSGVTGPANILQLRLRLPLDFIPNPRNLLSKLLSFPSVLDIPNSATYIPDFLKALKHLIKVDAEGVFNVVNYGGLRYRELLEEYRKYNPNHNYSIIDIHELKMSRTNLLLSTDKLEETGFIVRDIHDVIPECVEQYVNIVKKNGQQLL